MKQRNCGTDFDKRSIVARLAGTVEDPPGASRRWVYWSVLLVYFWTSPLWTGAAPSGVTVLPRGVTYTNYHVPKVPWSIHVVTVPRPDPEFVIHSTHARGEVLGLSTLTDQVQLARQRLGIPVAAINGDFYQRDKAYAGDPRGLQIAGGELLRGPNGGVDFWIDAARAPHAGTLISHFEITWPDGSVTGFRLNEERRATNLVLYTPGIGASTRTTGGRELILEPVEGGRWLPLRVGLDYRARVRRISNAGNSAVERGTLVLSVPPASLVRIPDVQTGAVLRITTATVPPLHGITTAMGGGPLLVRSGRAVKNYPAENESYEFSSMLERHPRSAIGWNDSFFYLIEVDGRQKELSAGMTLRELAEFLVNLGCEEAMNLDGGGSATLWYNGQVRNSPCDGYERPIANSLVVVRREPSRGN